MTMAYASKYYDPVKAHEYYMQTRELKGYEDRYGGSRGNGTSAASGGGTNYATQPSNSTQTSYSGYSGTYTRSNSASGSTSAKKTANEERRNANAQINAQIKSATKEHKSNLAKQKSEIARLRAEFSKFSADDKRANRVAYMDMIHDIENNIKNSTNAYNDAVQSLKEGYRGASTSGFNEKGKAAAAYIKKQMEEERDEMTKKANKEVDNSMLDDVKKLRNEIQAQRESGIGASKGKFLSKINSLAKKAKSTKDKALVQRKAEYQEKYVAEIEKLRKDQSMHIYYEKRDERLSKQEKDEAKWQQRRQDTVDRIDAYNKRKAETEARKAQRAAEKAARQASGGSSSSQGDSTYRGNYARAGHPNGYSYDSNLGYDPKHERIKKDGTLAPRTKAMAAYYVDQALQLADYYRQTGNMSEYNNAIKIANQYQDYYNRLKR